MIEFDGIISSKCKKFFLSDGRQYVAIGFLIGMFPLIGASIWLAIDGYSLFAWCVVPIILMFLFFILLKPGTKLYDFFNVAYVGDLMFNVQISDGVLSAEIGKRCDVRNINDIKKIVDYGDWYKIYFYFPHKSNAFICQKDLITQGTIEEFEEMFAGYIVKKQLKK